MNLESFKNNGKYDNFRLLRKDAKLVIIKKTNYKTGFEKEKKYFIL